MYLDYTIMWVDDEIDWSKRQARQLREYLSGKGFRLFPIFIETAEKLNEQLQSSQCIDLIFMDYNFNAAENGIDLVLKIRRKDIFAETIFCSGQDVDLQELIKKEPDENIQGIFVRSKQDDEALTFAKKIMEYRINREMDEMSMRGVAMATVALFDEVIFKILCRCNKKNEITEKVIKRLKERSKKILKLSQDKGKLWDSLSGNQSTIYWESSTRGIHFFAMVEALLNETCSHKGQCTIHGENYTKLLGIRNILAHHTSSQEELEASLIEILKHDASSQEDPRVSFRKMLITFSDIFNELENELCPRKQ